MLCQTFADIEKAAAGNKVCSSFAFMALYGSLEYLQELCDALNIVDDLYGTMMW